MSCVFASFVRNVYVKRFILLSHDTHFNCDNDLSFAKLQVLFVFSELGPNSLTCAALSPPASLRPEPECNTGEFIR